MKEGRGNLTPQCHSSEGWNPGELLLDPDFRRDGDRKA